MKKNIFVIGMNELNRERLGRLRGAEEIEFLPLLDYASIYETEDFHMAALIEVAQRQLDEHLDAGGSVDAIVGYADFPVSTMLPILAGKYGTRFASLESLLKCEHKFWSRIVQREAIPDHVPGFTAFDPFDDEALGKIGKAGLAFPFFVKPIKSSGSRLGFRIDNPEDFDYAIGKFRAEIGAYAEPFQHILDMADLPDEIRAVQGGFCMAEQVIGGRQCTLEGYVYNGEVVPYGVVDSIRYPQVLSFFYYMYPSKLPQRIQEKMGEITKEVMAHIGFDNSGFNVEFFWDEVQDRIWLLEINTRIAQSHCDLFEKVDGLSHQQVMVDLGLGQRPRMPKGEGGFGVAAEFFYRVFFRNATVARVPPPEEIAEAEARVPGTTIIPQVREGMRLSDLPEQDAYSFAIACIWMGANTQSSLLWNYERVVKAINFEFSEIDE